MSYYSPISNRNPEPNNRQLLTLLLIFATFFVSIFLLVNQLVNLIPISLEQKLGALIVPSYVQQSQPSTTQSQLNQLLDKLENFLPEKQSNQRDYQVLYIPKKNINALAIPGDTIIIYQGLLEKIGSENELIMILGHELGHFHNRDHLRSLGNILLIKIMLNYFLGDWENFRSGVDFLNIITNAQYSQKQEIKADQFGLKLLNKYYGHVGGATDFFERLKQEKKNNIDIDFLSTHPIPDKRIKQLNKLIKKEGFLIKSKQPLKL